jgi:hypothetical protein
MFKKIVFVCGVACALTSNAQSSNFEGVSVAVNYNMATLTTEIDNTTALGESSNNASIQGSYSFALSEKTLLSVGATYALGDLKAGSITSTFEIKAKNLYTVYVEPAYVIGATALYAKLAYIAMKGEATASGVSDSVNFNGTGYGFGVRTILDKNVFIQVEIMNAKFNSKTPDSVVIEPSGTVGTIGVGYKF